MPEHIQYQDDDLFNPETHHEESDVPIKPLFWAVAIFIVFAVVTHLVLAALYHGLVKEEKKRMDPPATQVALPVDAYVPKNQPLLQPFPHTAEQHPYQNTPVTDLAEMRARENERLHTFGWADQKNGIVHVPIDVAKGIMLQRGYPVGFTPPPPPPPPTGAGTAPDQPAGGQRSNAGGSTAGAPASSPAGQAASSPPPGVHP